VCVCMPLHWHWLVLYCMTEAKWRKETVITVLIYILNNLVVPLHYWTLNASLLFSSLLFQISYIIHKCHFGLSQAPFSFSSYIQQDTKHPFIYKQHYTIINIHIHRIRSSNTLYRHFWIARMYDNNLAPPPFPSPLFYPFSLRFHLSLHLFRFSKHRV
jgi:hypothetical protein